MPSGEFSKQVFEETEIPSVPLMSHYPAIGLPNTLHDEMVDYYKIAPTFDADTLMNVVIRRPSTDSLVNRGFSQTPLAPSKLIDIMEPYPQVGQRILMERVHTAAEEAGLEQYYEVIMGYEVSAEHDVRVKANTSAADRLYSHIAGQQLSEADADLLWEARTGDLSLAGAGALLLRYPVMKTIEGLKHTKPLDWYQATAAVDERIQQSIAELKQNPDYPAKMRLKYFKAKTKERDTRYFEISRDEPTPAIRRRQQAHILGMKENIAELTNGETTAELVRKTTLILLPAELELRAAIPRLRDRNGVTVNVQPVAVGCYWRVKNDQTNS